MVQIGKINQLTVTEISQFGAFLDGGNLGKILLPKRYTHSGIKPGTTQKVFIYLDSDDRLVATTETPKVMIDRFAFLKVVAVTPVGAFLDWGLQKDLLVPFREQKQKMQEGHSYLVYTYLDDATKRIVASAKIDKFLDNVSPQFQPGEKVDLLIIGSTNLGVKAIINQTHSGLIYNDEINEALNTGQRITGYIKRIREDDKIDLSLSAIGINAIEENARQLLHKLEQNSGFLPVTDHSSPQEIKLVLKMSKKAFKKAAGSLYKQKKINMEKDGIRLIR
ncbi:CvfB family protein [Thermophagus sp. OGC60D27]|uniref:CvfB family protein n=1 Tax=Thermophagus sp. OGC60D27 TaxID=3458415 RepID=UPI004037F7A3